MLTGFFITGTDTEVGKTTVTCGLISALRELGLKAAGFKPVASGCTLTDGGWVNDDALMLHAAAAMEPPFEWVNPYPLPEPTTPEIAASLQGIKIDPRPIINAFEAMSSRFSPLLVEGVGGYAVPFAKGFSQRDLARQLGLPVILVVGLKLGCINHALLTAQAIEADGLDLIGWIGNAIDPNLSFAGATTQLLTERIPAPCLGLVGRLPANDPKRVGGALLGVARRISGLLGSGVRQVHVA